MNDNESCPSDLPVIVLGHDDPVVQHFMLRLTREITNGMFYVLEAHSAKEAQDFCSDHRENLCFTVLGDKAVAKKVRQVAPQAKVILLMDHQPIRMTVQQNYWQTNEFAYAVRKAWRILKDLSEQDSLKDAKSMA